MNNNPEAEKYLQCLREKFTAERYYVDAFASLMGVCEKTVRRWYKRGILSKYCGERVKLEITRSPGDNIAISRDSAIKFCMEYEDLW